MNRNEILNGGSCPTLKPITPETIPLEMRQEPRWLRWNWRNKGRWSKVPVGKTDDPTTWSDFQTIWESYQAGHCDGIGFCLGDGWTGIDLDDCRSADGELTPLAHEIIAAIDSYAEVSPTGTGVKIYLRGTLPKGPTKSAAGDVEVYTSGRYFCVTGDKLSGDVGDRQDELEAVYRQYIGVKTVKAAKEVGTGIVSPAVDAMRRIMPKPDEKDGTNRLFAMACRAVEHNLSDDDAVAAIREVEKDSPLPLTFSDADILKRVRDAENKVVRGSARATVLIGNDFPKAVADTIEALANSQIYQHVGQLTTIVHQPEKCKFAKVDNGSPRLSFIPKDGMLETLTSAADFFAFDGRTKVHKQTLPKADLRNAIHCRGHYPGVRPLHGVVCRPILLPTGEIATTPGYHADTGLYLHIDGDWPATCSTDKAVAKLLDIWTDFPFASAASQAASLAALLTLLCRQMIDGNTPVFVVDGNRSRVGKGLLTDSWTMIVEDRRASRYSLSSQDELRKFLTSVAVQGGEYVLFDNLVDRFGGATLEAAMTSGTIHDRIMGLSKTIDLPLQITWMATGNGYNCSKDMVGRTVPIQLDIQMTNPETRDGFKYDDLLLHIRENRRELLIAGLSIVSNYILAGSPGQDIKPFGGFKPWSDLIRNAVVFAGLADPLSDRAQLIETADEGTEPVIKQLLEAWSFGEATTVKKALETVANDDAYIRLRSIAEDHGKDVTTAEYLGRLLRSANGRVIDSRKFRRTDHKVPKWEVVMA